MPNTQLAARRPRAGNMAAEDHIARHGRQGARGHGRYTPRRLLPTARRASTRPSPRSPGRSTSRENARRLAEIAVDVTGIGEVESKVVKNQRKTFGTLRDLLRAKSTGIIEEIPEKGIVKYAKPVGVVGAITPVHQPVRHARQQGHDGAEGRQCHHHRAAADGVGGQQARRRRHARGAGKDRAAGGPGADPAQSGDARVDHAADGAGRPGGRHRQPGQRARRLQVRQAGASASGSATPR